MRKFVSFVSVFVFLCFCDFHASTRSFAEASDDSIERAEEAIAHEWVDEDGSFELAYFQSKQRIDETNRDGKKDNPETMQELFDWAIKNSDQARLRELAAEMKKLPDEASDGEEKVSNSRFTKEELEQKRRDIREILDQMAMNPTEVEILKEVVEVFSEKANEMRVRVRALERLDDMVAQIDLAFDFHTIMGLKPLLSVIEDEGEMSEVRAHSCQVFATVTSNFEKIQEIAADDFNAVSVLLNATSLAFEKKDDVVAKKCLFALTSLTRNVRRLREDYLFNSDDFVMGKMDHAKYLFKSSLITKKSLIADAVWTRTANFLSDIVINAKHDGRLTDTETELVANLFKDDLDAIKDAAKQVQVRFNSQNVSEREAAAHLALAMIDSKDETFKREFRKIEFEHDLLSHEVNFPKDSLDFRHLIKDIQRAFKKGTRDEL
jgi:hypothetical protein